MGHPNFPPWKRTNTRQWRLLDLISIAFFSLLFLFFVLFYTTLGGRRVVGPSTVDPQQRIRLVVEIEEGLPNGRTIEACPASEVDHMPCEDPRRNSQLSREMNYYRERHCPPPEETALCLIPPPNGYRVPVRWPESMHKIWHSNMPHNKIADRKGHQGWMKREGQHFLFPGGGTMFPDGAEQYIEKLGQYIPINGGVLRTALDMGCGKIYHADATYFIEVDRLLRPGGYLVISGPPVRWPKQEKEWSDLQAVAKALCYEQITVDGNTAIWKKPTTVSCLPNENGFGLELCDDSGDVSQAWYFKLKKCVSSTSSIKGDYAVGTIPKWPERLTAAPSRSTLLKTGAGEYEVDTKLWARRVAHYKNSLNIKLGTPSIRNVMDMNALYGGFAAALKSDPVWVMNVVPAQKPPTLDAIFDRGLIGVYHDWCEPFSTYPRTYDLIHASSIESFIKDPASGKSRCNIVDLMVEIDRILRPEGTVVVRDTPEVIDKVARIAHAVRWKPTIYDKEPDSHGREKILVLTKTFWKL
ncbi:hypothetical protein TSUD_159810 [Trifolium subterraneum]|uniref:Methyltransferase n=1 Tax=Trifolium subterraneum TaxID=3900 RepID=A0A2Z6NEK6_TRISU|nr:hypothetical protein TSUD_159810 [Trifolium subterraneum]